MSSFRGFLFFDTQHMVMCLNVKVVIRPFNNLQLRHFVSQMMAKHHKNVQKLVEIGKNMMKDTFLCEQDIWNIAEKLVMETYKKHENDVESVCMWVQKNPNILFYFQKIGTEVSGELLGSNIPFIIKIQTP
jgi:hypothetical protein